MAAVAMQPSSVDDVPITPEPHIKTEPDSKPTLTPPASEEADKAGDNSSELSEPDFDSEDIGDIEPDHYYEGGRVPVFKPTMKQFKSFKTFIDKIDKYGMKSGIIKVIPPPEWRDALPALDEQVKKIKVKNPITQEFHGAHGTYTQANMEKQRSYNLPQWKALTEESNHQPPAKRGERRRNQDRPVRSSTPRSTRSTPAAKNSVAAEHKKRGPGRQRGRPSTASGKDTQQEGEGSEAAEAASTEDLQVPPTPVSPAAKPSKLKKSEEPDTPSKPKGRQPKSVSSRRKHNSGEQADEVDEEAFKGFDYRANNQEEWTAERCQELEVAYWKSLNFSNPLYGADMPGSLFDDRTESWNVAKLENLLDVLGQKVPGVNTAYLYLGMWKATFAWHLEDVDLYSINYIHFGAPKQWYSISQEDARRFEAAMRNVWPQDAKNCDQFLRHKTYLISPSLLKSQYNIEVNRLVHYEGEFVITFPYGYHSGYNLGYNCAESVNFATEAWLDYGKIAKKCNCEADSVWVDVWDIERKLRGEPTPEYMEYIEDYEDEDEEVMDLPTPPGSDKGQPRSRKRKAPDKDSKEKVKRVRLTVPKAPAKPVCVLCPHDLPFEELLPTEEGEKAHRVCALYIPETYLTGPEGAEVVCGVKTIDKKRFDLRCLACRAKNGAVFQCSNRKCARGYHPTCAAAAGVSVEIGMRSCYAEDGTEYADVAIDFRCRFHRAKRPKYADELNCVEALEKDPLIRKHAASLQRGDVVQFQYYGGEIHAGYVVENRFSEETVVLQLIPQRREIEVEWKWILTFDKANSQLVPPSANAIPLPAHLAHKSQTSHEDPTNEIPKPDDPFHDPACSQKWAEFHIPVVTFPRNTEQAKVDFSRPNSIWHYLGKNSTEAKARWTGDPAIRRNNPAANFLDTVRPPPALTNKPTPRMGAALPVGDGHPSASGARSAVKPPQLSVNTQGGKPYKGKYALDNDLRVKGGSVDPQALRNQHTFLNTYASQHAHSSTIGTGSSSSSSSTGYQNIAPAPKSAGAAAPTALPTMADVHRRQSNPHRLSLDEVRQMQWPQVAGPRPPPPSGGPPSSSGQQQQRPQQPQQRIAIAPMMAANKSPTTQSTFSRPSTSTHTPPSTGVSLGSRSRSESLKKLPDYPYLREAALNRPAVYQSPYGPPGSFTDAWLPNPPKVTKPMRPRSTSLAQDFLTKATPSQREAVKGHVRTISTEKATLHAQESERRQREQLQRMQLNNLLGPSSPSFSQGSGMFGSDAFPPLPPRGFTDSPSFPDFNLAPLHHPSNSSFFAHDASLSFANTQHGGPSVSNSTHAHGAPSTLQFQSPQDFNQQMQHESDVLQHQQNQQNQHHQSHDHGLPKTQMMSHGRNSYSAFQRRMNEGSMNMSSINSMDSMNMGGMNMNMPMNANLPFSSVHPHAHGAQDIPGVGGGHGGVGAVGHGLGVGVGGVGGVGMHGGMEMEMDGVVVGGGDGTSGSPLRRGRGGVGGEMLPMMQDPSF